MESDMHRIHTDKLNGKEKRALWDEIIQDFLNSGEQFTTYSRKHQLNYDQLLYHVRAYKTKQANKSQKFLPVQVTEAPPSADIKVVYADVTVKLPSTMSCEYVVKLVQGLCKPC